MAEWLTPEENPYRNRKSAPPEADWGIRARCFDEGAEAQLAKSHRTRPELRKLKPVNISNEYGDFYDWCQRLRNGQIDGDTLFQWVLDQILALFDEKEIRKQERERIIAFLEKEYPPITTWLCWKALKEGK